MKQPFFSIIVAAYNAEDTIEKTILSVLNQSFDDYEIVVKDGGSADSTLSKIPESEKVLIHSSRDGGIYQGMNEGISYASGKYLLFLNCGDLLDNADVLARVYANANLLNDTRNIVYGNYCRNGVVFKQPSSITPFYLYRTPLCHQSMFFGREVFDEFGVYETDYKILADYNHTLTAFFADVPFVYSDTVICNYLGGGASESQKGIEIKKKEYAILREKYFSKKQIKRYNIKLFFSMKKLRQKLISDKSPRWIRKAYRKIINTVNR